MKSRRNHNRDLTKKLLAIAPRLKDSYSEMHNTVNRWPRVCVAMKE